jgi:hypothetical protein
VPLVQVKDTRIDPERFQRPHTADAQNDFLLDAGLTVAAVEARRQLAIPWRVFLEAGVEEV